MTSRSRSASTPSRGEIWNLRLSLLRSSARRLLAPSHRSAEAEHREILRETLLEGTGDFVSRARELRNRLRSSVDSTDTIRSYRDRDSAA